MILLKNILVATDFSAPSDAAIAYGRELALSFGARLTVFHAAENIAARGYGADGFVFTDLGVPHDYEAAAHRQIDAMNCGENGGGLKRISVVVTSNQPASAIVDYARQAGIDLIVMGTHGRGAVAHLLMGSVAERVVRNAPCPVLTVRHPEREFVLPDALVGAASHCTSL
jgi:nucleotide-binding universal stress UspA family protein